MDQLNELEAGELPEDANPLDNPYLLAYHEAQAEEVARIQEFRQQYEAAADSRFFENCRIWLGGMWDEIEPDDIIIRWKKEQLHPNLHMGFTWNGCIPGYIESSAIDQPFIVFKIADIEKTFGLPFHQGESKKIAYDQQALEVDPVRFGEFLASVLGVYTKHVLWEQENQRIQRQAELNRIKDDLACAYDPERLDALLADALEKHPQKSAHWQELAEKRRKSLLQDQQKSAEQEARNQDYQAEQEAIEEAARQAFTPFTVYEITASIGVDSELINPYIATFYSLSPEPEADGWWRVFCCVREICRSNIPHIVSIVEKRIEWGDPLVWQLCREEPLISEKFPEIRASIYTLPDGKE